MCSETIFEYQLILFYNVLIEAPSGACLYNTLTIIAMVFYKCFISLCLLKEKRESSEIQFKSLTHGVNGDMCT